MLKKLVLLNVVIYFLLFMQITIAFTNDNTAPQVTQLSLAIHITEIKIKDDKDVDNDGEFHFWRKMNGQNVRLPQNGEITRKKNEYILPTDPNLGNEAFWNYSWFENGTFTRKIEFDAWEADTWPDNDDYLDKVSTDLDLSTFQFINENTNHQLENSNYHIRFTITCIPQIFSNTHPDSTKTYEKATLALNWAPLMPAVGIIGYSYSIDELPQTEPDEFFEGTYTTFSLHLREDNQEHTYWFHLKAGDKLGFWSNTGHFRLNTGHYQIDSFTGETPSLATPLPEIHLYPNYPNPFNSQTIIPCELANAGRITIKIYNLNGQLVRELFNGLRTAGPHQFIWNGKNDRQQDLPAGIYLYTFRAGPLIQTHKMTLLR